MKIGCFIPIKQYSERVKGKNFREISGLPLYKIIIDKCLNSDVFTSIHVDTDSAEIADFSKNLGAIHIERKKELALNTANGNDLIVHHLNLFPDFDYFFQIFATAPLIKISTIKKSVDALVNSAEHDSVLTSIDHHGMFWRAGMPLSYRPDVLPRTQDMLPVHEETTALYGIRSEALNKYRCRVGAKPMFVPVSKLESVDLNTDDDFAYAQWLVETNRASISE